VATKTYEERKTKETKAKVLDLSIFYIILLYITYLSILFNFNTENPRGF